MASSGDAGRRFRAYLLALGVVVVGGSAGLASFNWRVDPFGYFGLDASSASRGRPDLPTHTRLHKARQITFVKPRTVYLGSSRVEAGLEPRYDGWAASARPVYNLGLSSASMYEIRRCLQHAHAIQPLVQAVLGLDFYMFLAMDAGKTDFDDARLAHPEARTLSWRYYDLFTVLFSVDTLKSAYRTLRDPGSPMYRHDGMRNADQMARVVAAQGGALGAARDYERQFMRSWAQTGRKGAPLSDAALAEFSRIVDFCAGAGIDLVVYISPTHARDMELVAAVGLWPAFETWKRRLAGALDGADGPSGRVWDFSGYHWASTEPFPSSSSGSRREMEWYFESSHFRPGLGRLMLDAITGRRPPQLAPFGDVLTLRGVDRHLAKVRTDQMAFRSRVPEIFAEIAAAYEGCDRYQNRK